MNLINYIKGKRKGKEAHNIERDAMTDPFLSDALDGYQNISGNHIEAINRLQKKLLKPKKRNRFAYISGAAASIILLISVGGYFMFINDSVKPLTHIEKITKTEVVPEQKPIETEITEATKNKKEHKKTDIAQDKVAHNPKDAIKTETQKTAATPVTPAVTQNERKLVEEINAENIAADFQSITDLGYIQQETLKEIPLKKIPLKKNITGTIVSKDGEPLPFATIKIKGTNDGTLADEKGMFSLELTDNAKILVADYIGFESSEFVADTINPMLIALEDNARTLDEVVVGRISKKLKINSTQAVSKERKTDPAPVMGYPKFNKYIKENTKQPTNEWANVKGKVVISFYVNTSGKPYSFKVEKSICPAADNEAIRLIQESGQWIYGNQQVKITVKF